MGRVAGDMEHERLRLIAVADAPDGLVADEFSGIAGFIEGLAVAMPIEAAFTLVLVIVVGSVEVAIGTLEASRAGEIGPACMSEVPQKVTSTQHN